MEDKKQNNQIRPPIVAVLGHVDHGKTSLLDYIRKTNVTEKESGGITQHIGAYEAECDNKKITFIDTPGHEAFSAMRSRGAKVADIAILIIAAEEGIKPQTKEAISFIKLAGIPMIVALNKIDKPQADPEKVKTELSQIDVLVESRAGKVPSVNISTKTGQGIPDLLELILLIAEMQDLRGDINKSAQGVVIEAYLDDQRGPVATLLLRDGVLKQGDIIGTKSSFGKAKILENFKGEAMEKVMPSNPAVVIGFEQAPQVGEEFEIYSDIDSAREYIEQRQKKIKQASVYEFDASKKVLNLILKADVSGTLEAIEQAFKNFPQDKVILRTLKSQVGDVNENDVKLAKASNAKIICFRQKINPGAKNLAHRMGVKIKIYDIIYELFQGVREMAQKILSTEIIRKDMGKIKILLVFRTEKARQIVGGKIIEGEADRKAKIEVWRNDEKIGDGKIIGLQKNKKNIDSAKKGEEIGILYKGSARIEQDDELVLYTEESVKEQL
ncbi:MAG: translation initiation factor IF-2 [Patescibacteria group bacterium]|nr:translation initiation factor IF-2 [Patescibacteria group bacterium]